MLIVRITSGLGNQMYQYNFYRLLKEMYPKQKVVCDLSWFKVNDDHHGYELERLFAHDGSDFEIEKASAGDVRRVSGQFPPLFSGKAGKLVWFLEGPVNRILRERFGSTAKVELIDQLDGEVSNKDVIKEDGSRSNPLYELITGLDDTKDYYIQGFWIEERYVKPRLARIQKELIFKEPTDDANIALIKKIQESDSVSIHVRRGDYLSAAYASMFKSLGKEYYERAVSLIRDKMDAPRFFLFSDDPEYMKEAFSWLENKEIVDINHGDDSYKDMILMSRCKANIIANSTFSQWAAILNSDPDKIVIYPKDYLSDEDSEIKTYNGWIRI